MDYVNNGLQAIPSTKNWIADFTLLIESGIRNLISKNGLDNFYFIGEKFIDSEENWIAFFTSPFTTHWYFHNFNSKITEKDLVFLSDLNEIEHNIDKIILINDIYLFKEVPSFFKNSLTSIGEGSKGKSSKDANFMKINNPLFHKSIKNIKDALELIKENSIGFYYDFLSFVKCIALVDEKASFRGATALNRNGFLFFSPDENWDKYKWAEELVHETTHCIIYVLSARYPVVEGEEAFELKYQGPFRPDLRHLYGNFHALTVMSRCIVLFENIMKNNLELSALMQQKIDEFKYKAKIPFKELKENAKFSELGMYIFETIIAPKFEI